MNALRLLLAAALAFLPLADAVAGTSTITTKDASGATKTFVVTTDGSGQFVAQGVICDQSAAAQCATVTAGNALKVDGSAVTQPVSGTVTANAGTGNFTVVNGGTFAVQSDLTKMGGTSINSGCVGALNGFSAAVPSTVCGVFGTYVINAAANGSHNTANSTTVNVATDQAAIAAWGQGATGSASPSGATQVGFALGANMSTPRMCQSTAKYDASTNGSTELVALTSSQTIRICSYLLVTGGTATNVKLVYGTGTNCATGATDITPAFVLAANDKIGEVWTYWQGMATAASNALCVNASAGNPVQVFVTYDKAP